MILNTPLPILAPGTLCCDERYSGTEKEAHGVSLPTGKRDHPRPDRVDRVPMAMAGRSVRCGPAKAPFENTPPRSKTKSLLRLEIISSYGYRKPGTAR